jgi:phosphate transport system protein
MLHEQIDELKARLVTYGRFVEEMIEGSIKAFLDGRPEALREIIEASEPAANETELELERECTALIAQWQPKARDLRTILMVLGMTNDLERMADHAVNIAEAGLSLLARPGAKPPQSVPRMAQEAIRMVDQGIQAFISEEVELAQKICVNDNVVDDLATAILKELVSVMAGDPSTIERNLLILKMAANLERIADLSTNICEDVIYLVQGRVIKHHKEDRA